MTAEIAVLNKSAVALAADSKVTVGSSGSHKTYDTVNKVFTLSKFNPVGVMIYGNAEFMGYAWELIIKQYRKHSGQKSMDTVREWADDFLRYLQDFGEIDDDQKRENTTAIVVSALEEVEEIANHRASESSIPIPSPDFLGILSAVLAKRVDLLSLNDVCITEEKSDILINKYSSSISDAISHSFAAEDSELQRQAIAYSIRVLFTTYFSSLKTGIVIAGFGEKQLFPQLISYETDGYVGDEIKICETTNTEITKEMRSCVQSFAQSDMTNRFMDGIDSIYSNWLSGAFHDALTTSCLTVLDEYGKRGSKNANIREAVSQSAKQQAIDLSERASRYRRKKFSTPILDMVALLPKDELAQMAESLVALTSFKRRVSTDAETVGGPVDVAIISKEDGFVWIKRKHYFKQELNPHFVSLYLRDTL